MVLAQVPATEMDDVAVYVVGSEVHAISKSIVVWCNQSGAISKTCVIIIQHSIFCNSLLVRHVVFLVPLSFFNAFSV